MDSNIPKVSFIPKSSLVREESFLNRPRPRSAIGVLATLVFLASLGGYGGLYYYNVSLSKKIEIKTNEIRGAQKEFIGAPEIEKAKIFRSRVDLAKELIDKHTVVSPVLLFISENTLESILYDSFLFTHDKTGGATLVLKGEAPSYGALAYQGDIFRMKNNELSGVSISNVELTKFGTVTFMATITFNQDYISYSKHLNASSVGAPKDNRMATTTSVSDLATSSRSLLYNTGTSTQIATTTGMVVELQQSIPVRPTTTPVIVKPTNKSIMGSLWSRFKFW